MTPPWLTVKQGTAPLLVSMPHTGIDLAGLDNRLVSSWLGQRDCDWWIDKLYDFAAGLGATVVHTAISRTVIDVNRDPSGASLYPGQATTGLCPTETFDGDPLYRTGEEPGPSEIDERRRKFFMPYHAALQAEIDRLRGLHGKIVLYDCHSIRSVLPRLFDGTLPVFNLGTNDGKSTDPALQEKVAGILAETGETFVVNGRFKGGWITRHFGQPQNGVHALQMELSNRGYMREPEGKGAPDNWPAPYDAAFAAPIRTTLTSILETAISWVES
ncbi:MULTISPECIES: N-formylglutamate deformylase [unclassified Mesorhizobium]|uniref:N-formylglutamate deformylase n=1 Tax=unclassified Mesorhizobium TaxID=325217 RepID=UPI00112C935C|nr:MULTISPECIES: N-formylglutamate deformylase [unclassified Mesorhizobium]MBZ9808435.1 N-formylglutamate deformylase [Mesorhizobium sp. ESP-6-2]TPM33431.1 N-formylglutamate deformylase [Mesorhizobium sp. B2-2-2]